MEIDENITIKKHIKKKKESNPNSNINQIINQDYSRNRYELSFLIDATGSMGKYINGVRESLKILISELAEIFEETQSREDVLISMSFYRDFEDTDQFEMVDFVKFTKETAVEGSIISKLEKIKPYGGGDAAEDIRGGLENVLDRLEWKGRKKYIILIADAPCHGKKFNGGCSDNYPDDKGLKEVLDKIIDNEFFFIILELDDSTNVMVEEIKKIYSSNPENCEHRLIIESLKNLKDVSNIKVIAERISKAVSGSISKTITRHHKKKI